MTDPGTAYAQAAVSGDVIVGPYVRAMCERHLADLERQDTKGFRFYYDREAVAHVVEYFREILILDWQSPITDEDGVVRTEQYLQPFEMLGWQAFCTGSLFGWRRSGSGFRRFRTAYIETGKGSGKSPWGAGVGLYCLTADGERRPECFSVAVDKTQAQILFLDAVSMARLSPALMRRLRISGGEGKEDNIYSAENGGKFRPLSTETKGRGKGGLRVHCGIVDEFSEHQGSAMVDAMDFGTKARRNSLVIKLTNAGWDRDSVCFQERTKAIRVATGEEIDPTYFGFVCSSEEGEDPIWDDADPALGCPASWHKTNPSLGTVLPIEYVERMVQGARGIPAREAKVRRLTFCEWTAAEAPWISPEVWMTCEREQAELPDVESYPAFLGLDLANIHDMISAAWVVRLPDDRLVAQVRCFRPAETLADYENRDGVPYQRWVSEGHLTTVPGKIMSFDDVADDLSDWLTDPVVEACAFDPYRIADFRAAMERVGLSSWIWDGPDTIPGVGLRMVRHAQGYAGGDSDRSLWMNRSIEEIESAILGGRLLVLRSHPLRWAVSSAVLRSNEHEARKWVKREAKKRIDPIVALSMAVGAAMNGDPPSPPPSITFMEPEPEEDTASNGSGLLGSEWW